MAGNHQESPEQVTPPAKRLTGDLEGNYHFQP